MGNALPTGGAGLSFSRDIVYSMTVGNKQRIDGLRQMVTEHEEKDKKPLKTLSEVIEEKMQEAKK